PPRGRGLSVVSGPCTHDVLEAGVVLQAEDREVTVPGPRGQSRVQVVHTDAEPGGTGGSDFYTINCEYEVVYLLAGSIEILFTDRRVALVAGDAPWSGSA
ncbi:MAG: hypothetical protein QOH03_4625, partial [Kribbellaceae bacterium]|nr:hypothetical protein [Kribbellaceae bacterium]